jgi:hypothetical protein
MANANTLFEKDPNARSIVAFPNIGDFYNILYDRLYTVIEEFYLEDQDTPFTLLINALPRDHQVNTLIYFNRKIQPPLKYIGLDKQKDFLSRKSKQINSKKLDDAWKYLSEKYLTEGQATNQLYADIQNSRTSIYDIKSGRLVDYFDNLKTQQNSFTEAEQVILTTFLDWKDYNYTSIPLFQFGELDGIVHIIYHKNEHKNMFDFEDKPLFQFFKKLINAVRIAYEELMLDWEVEGKFYNFKEKAVLRVIDPEYDINLYNRMKEIPILIELRVKEYYEKHKDYFNYRFKLADMIPDVMQEQYGRTANLSVVVDSFAHNITAHSMTAVERLLRKIESSLPEKDYSVLIVVLRLLRPYIKYILEKGAFWTGALRGISYGGVVSDLYTVLWDGFANNPLFLGSVVRSEGVNKVNIKVSFLEHSGHKAGIHFKKKVLYSGSLCHVDLSELYRAIDSKAERLEKAIESNIDPEVVSRLKNIHVFFPGAVVGFHALYTILENELRNIKHYDNDVIEGMRANGLTLHLSIEEDRIIKQSGGLDYYKLEIWLEHPTKLSQEHLTKRLTRLDEDIIDKEAMNRPRLGGTSQDKICASFLFNNNFNSKDVSAEKRAKRFYPWVKIGSSKILANGSSDLEEEYCLSARRILHPGHEDAKEYFEENYKPDMGVFKKYIHLWRGADVHKLPKADNIDSEIDNPSRFRFINIDDAPAITFQRLRERGFFRIIRENVDNIEQAYPLWLNQWFQSNEQELRIKINRSDLGSIILNSNQIYFDPEADHPITIENPIALKTELIHSTIGKHNKLLNYRNHGAFIQKFFPSALQWDSSQNKYIAKGAFSICPPQQKVIFEKKDGEQC